MPPRAGEKHTAGQEGERPGQLTIPPKPDGLAQASGKEGQAGTPLAPLIEQEVLEKLKLTPQGEDPAFWPIRLSNELEYYITIKNDPSASPVARAIGKKYAPHEESIRRVKTAYAILAHPHCQQEGWKEQIGAQLETRRQFFGQDQVEMNDQELNVLNQITTARKIPFNPKKRVYSHSEVPIEPWINPSLYRYINLGKKME